MVVEAMPDPVGLKMGVVVGVNLELQELIYQRFQCKNEAIFNISEITGEDISFYGGSCFTKLSLNCLALTFILKNPLPVQALMILFILDSYFMYIAFLSDVDPLGKGKIREKESIPFEMACSTLKLPKKNPPNGSFAMDSSAHSNSSAGNSVINGQNGKNGNVGNNRQGNGPAMKTDNHLPPNPPKLRNNMSDNSLHNGSHNNLPVPKGMEDAFDKVTSAFGNLDSKLKGAAAKLDPNYKQKEANAAAERERLEAESRAKLEKEKKAAAIKWEAELKRIKDEKRVVEENEAEQIAIDMLLRVLKESEEEDAATAVAQEVLEVEEQAAIEAAALFEKNHKDKKKTEKDIPASSSAIKKKNATDSKSIPQPANKKKNKKNTTDDDDDDSDDETIAAQKKKDKSKDKTKGRKTDNDDENSDDDHMDKKKKKKVTKGKKGKLEKDSDEENSEEEDSDDDTVAKRKKEKAKAKAKTRKNNAPVVGTTCTTPCTLS